jgi:hypothetical protein
METLVAMVPKTDTLIPLQSITITAILLQSPFIKHEKTELLPLGGWHIPASAQHLSQQLQQQPQGEL